MLVERNVPLQAHNTFGISAKALQLVRVQSEEDIHALISDPQWREPPKFVLGGGSNIVLTGDVKALVLKVELKGMRLVEETEKAWIVEAAAGGEEAGARGECRRQERAARARGGDLSAGLRIARGHQLFDLCLGCASC